MIIYVYPQQDATPETTPEPTQSWVVPWNTPTPMPAVDPPLVDFTDQLVTQLADGSEWGVNFYQSANRNGAIDVILLFVVLMMIFLGVRHLIRYAQDAL